MSKKKILRIFSLLIVFLFVLNSGGSLEFLKGGHLNILGNRVMAAEFVNLNSGTWQSGLANIMTSVKLSDGNIMLAGGNGKWEIISQEGNMVLRNSISGMETICTSQVLNNGNRFLAGDNRKYFIIGANGNTVSSYDNGFGYRFLASSKFSDGGIISAMETGEYVILNNQGTLTQNKFWIYDVYECPITVTVLGNNNVILAGSHGKWQIINNSGGNVAYGTWIHGSTHIKASTLMNNGNIFLVGENGKWQILNSNGQSIAYGTLGNCMEPWSSLLLDDGNILIAGYSGKWEMVNNGGTSIRSGTWCHGSSACIFTLTKINSRKVFFGGVDGKFAIYTFNNVPLLTVCSPSYNAAFGETDTQVIPQISVSDPDNDPLTCKYYVDSETTARDTKTASNTSSSQTVALSTLDMSTLTEGNHTLKMEISDGIASPVQSTVNIKVDKSMPTLGTITATSTTSSITVSGSAIDSIAGLDVLPYRYTIGTNPTTSWLANSSYTQNLLTPNTQYAVKFEARDAKGHIAENIQNVYTKAEVPTLSVINPTSYTLTVATTDNNPTSTQYQISNGTQYITPEGTLTSSPIWVTLPSKQIVVRNLSPNTTYTFTAKAKNAEGIETSLSAPASGTTLVEPPAPPTNLTATATGNSITVNWDAAAGATGYEIEAGGTVVDTGIDTIYTHIGLTPDTQYTYRVRARNAGGAGAWSSPITKSTQALSPWTPLNVNAAATTTSVIVTWSAVGGASGYDVEVDGTVVNNGSSTNYIHNGLTPGTQHSYRVRSINSGGKSDWSNEILIYTLAEKPPVPANLGGTAARDQVTLTWDTVTGATYDLKIDGTEVNSITGTTYTHNGLTPGTQHTYQARAKKNGGISDWSATLTLSTLPDTFGTPSGFKAEAADTSVLLSWNAVAGATGYDVEVDGAVLDNGTDTTAAFAGLTPNTQHNYRVRAKSATETSDWSTSITITTFLLPTPINITAQSTDTTITVNWDAVTGAESYDLEIDGTVIENLAAATYTFTGLVPNTQHAFKVKAKNASGTSAWSVPLTKSTEFNAFNIPANVAAMVKNNHITIVWSAVANATAYDIEVDGAVTENITGTSYLHNGLTPGTQHTYRVRAKKGTVTGGWSNTLTISTLPEGPQTPANVTASATTTSIMITWDEVDNATGYEIEVDGTVIDNGMGISYLHSGLSPNTQHTYKVRSRNASGTSTWSPVVTMNTRSSTETYIVDCENNEVFNLVFMASDIQDPSAYTFTVTYDTQELEVLDLCGITPRVDLAIGNLVGTDVQVVQFTPGTIVFKKVTAVQQGQSWSGAVNSIKFRSKVSGQADVIYSIQ